MSEARAQRSGRTLSMWVLLDRGGEGQAIRLTVERTGGPPGLSADAASDHDALRDAGFRRAEATASAVLRARLPGAAVRYRLTRADGTPYDEPIGDGSMGAALTVAALRCAGRGRLRTLDPRCAMTGTVGSDGSIGPVDPNGLAAKARAAERAGVRRLVVPAEQTALLPPLARMRVAEAESVDRAVRLTGVVPTRVKAAALATIAALVLTAVGVQTHRAAESGRDARGSLAATRAMTRAADLVSTDPRMSLELAAAAAALEPEATEGARAAIAASLPPGIAYLPDPPAPVEATAWTASGIEAATATQWLRLDLRRRRWLVEAPLAAHRLAAFAADGRTLLLAGRAGATAMRLGGGRSPTLTASPVRAAVAGTHDVAVLTASGAIVRTTDRGPLRTVVAQRPVSALAMTDADRLVAVDRAERVLAEHGDRLGDDSRQLTSHPTGTRVTLLAAHRGQLVGSTDDGRVLHDDPRQPLVAGPSSTTPRAIAALGWSQSAVAREEELEIGVADLITVRTRARLPGRFDALAISPDRRQLLAAGTQAAVVPLDTFRFSTRLISSVLAFGPGPDLTALASDDASISRLPPGRTARTLSTGRPFGPGVVRLSPNGRWAAEVRDGHLITWDVRTGQRTRVLPGRKPGMVSPLYYNVAPLDDGDVAASSGSETDDSGLTYLIDHETGAVGQRIYQQGGPFTQSMPGSREILLSHGSALDLVRVGDMRRIERTRVAGERLTLAATSADGSQVFFGASSGGVWRWRPGRHERPTRIAQLDGAPYALAASPDGRLVFASTPEGTHVSHLHLIDVEGRRTTELPTPDTHSTLGATFSPDGRVLALGAVAPIGAELLSVHLDRDEACRAAGREVTPAAWRSATGGLDVSAPPCP